MVVYYIYDVTTKEMVNILDTPEQVKEYIGDNKNLEAVVHTYEV